jgi:hypothetical protein
MLQKLLQGNRKYPYYRTFHWLMVNYSKAPTLNILRTK